MHLHATHRRDGTAIEDGTLTTPPFLGFVEVPEEGRAETQGYPVLRVEGWVASRAGRGPARVRLQADDAPPVEVLPDRERPDVVRTLEPDFPVASAGCGFVAHVELPAVSGSRLVPVRIVVDDGDYLGRFVLLVRHGDAPPPPRADYAATWERESADETRAKVAAIGTAQEDYYLESARVAVAVLERTVGIGPDDDVLEIGCGVGRVGAALAPRCRRWVGADVSSNMLGHARRRLAGHANVELVRVNGWDLHQLPDASVDVAYATIVFMHLDEWDRYAYVEEAHRVLRPGGRCYVDNVDLNSRRGWALFEDLATRHHPLERPANISKTSTVEELRAYLERAGFEAIGVEAAAEDLFARVWGRRAP